MTLCTSGVRIIKKSLLKIWCPIITLPSILQIWRKRSCWSNISKDILTERSLSLILKFLILNLLRIEIEKESFTAKFSWKSGSEPRKRSCSDYQTKSFKSVIKIHQKLFSLQAQEQLLSSHLEKKSAQPLCTLILRNKILHFLKGWITRRKSFSTWSILQKKMKRLKTGTRRTQRRQDPPQQNTQVQMVTQGRHQI